jgi:hypothetical protein
MIFFPKTSDLNPIIKEKIKTQNGSAPSTLHRKV